MMSYNFYNQYRVAKPHVSQRHCPACLACVELGGHGFTQGARSGHMPYIRAARIHENALHASWIPATVVVSGGR